MFETNILLTSVLFTSIGTGYFLYGRKDQKYLIMLSGIILMVYPYSITNIYYMLGIGIFLIIFPFIVNKIFSLS